MKDNFQRCLRCVLKHEGGFSNNPLDPGGITNLGVTIKSWSRWLGRQATEDEMRKLTPDIVAPMYKAMFWDFIAGDNLPLGVDYVVFDFSVNSGPKRAARFLQSLVNVEVDEHIGKNTLAAVTTKDAKDLIKSFSEARQKYLTGLSTFDTFGKGWTRRVSEVNDKALTMVT
jgi:lysozyme family protein